MDILVHFCNTGTRYMHQVLSTSIRRTYPWILDWVSIFGLSSLTPNIESSIIFTWRKLFCLRLLIIGFLTILCDPYLYSSNIRHFVDNHYFIAVTLSFCFRPEAFLYKESPEAGLLIYERLRALVFCCLLKDLLVFS